MTLESLMTCISPICPSPISWRCLLFLFCFFVYLAYLPLAHILEVPAIFVLFFVLLFFVYLAYLPLAHILEVPAP